MPSRSHTPILNLSLDPKARTPIYQQLYGSLRKMILQGVLEVGTRLPSSRSLAEELSVSRNTVQAAVDQLCAEGYLLTRHGSGTFVSDDLPDTQLHTQGEVRQSEAPRAELVEDDAGRNLLEWRAFRPDYPDIAEFPFSTWKRLLYRHWRKPLPELLGYGTGRGYRPLRVAIANYLEKSRSAVCASSQIIVLPDTQMALSLVAKVLLKNGDSVWFENPGYTRACQTFKRVGASIVPIPVDEAGMQFERAISADPQARMAYLTPSHQYPLGHLMSLKRRLMLLDWASSQKSWIVEDDYGTYFRYSGCGVSSLQGLDEHGRVLYVGTFSRVIFPAIRMCYLVVPPSLVNRFVQARIEVDSHTTSLEQAVLADFIADGHFTRHIRRMRKLYGERQHALVTELSRQLGRHLLINPSQAGMHVVAYLREGRDDQDIERRAAEIGISVRALSSYYIKGRRARGFVLGFAPISVSEVHSAVKQFVSVF